MVHLLPHPQLKQQQFLLSTQRLPLLQGQGGPSAFPFVGHLGLLHRQQGEFVVPLLPHHQLRQQQFLLSTQRLPLLQGQGGPSAFPLGGHLGLLHR